MSTATIIYPHQLFRKHPAIKPERPIYLVEEPLLLTHNPIHRQKLILHKLSLDAYECFLREQNHSVTRLSVVDHPTTASIFTQLQQDGVTQMHIADTTDNYLEQAIRASVIERTWYESPLFLLSRDEAVERYTTSKRFMATFYKQLRRDRHILVTADGDPVGGQWSFDADNRNPLPADQPLPPELHLYGNDDTVAAAEWATTVSAEQYGDAGCWLPYTHTGAQAWLADFLTERLSEFGPYEDALTTRGVRLFHSALSPLINIGLLTPQEVLEAALSQHESTPVPLQSLEGFIRQVLGWREFMRASYECDGSTMRTKNFWKHDRALPKTFWQANTDIPPIDHVISTALRYGYTHHIERLMVMGNFLLLSETDPDEVYRWFMGMYLDAYDWVMVPNVYGMSQFADGGMFTTKPYISGANYIKKMSDYPGGDWETTWTALYWRFIDRHQEFFRNNYRLSMMLRVLDRMKPETREGHLNHAEAFLQQGPQ